ncbi:MAG: magnesium transporter [Deltaproteobacteria bacterium]
MNAASQPVQALLERYLETHPVSAARQLETHPTLEVASLLAVHGVPSAAEVIRRMAGERATRVLLDMGPERTTEVIQRLDPAHVAQLLARLEGDERERVLSPLPESLRGEITGLLSYPPGRAGALMDGRVMTFARSSPVRVALDRIRQARAEHIGDLIVVDDEGQFAGIVRLQDLVCADPGQHLEELARDSSIFVQPMTPREDVVELLNQHRLESLPVVDLHDRVVGVIRHAGLVDALQQDAAADLQQMVGGSAEERALSRPWVGVKGRLPWLHINLVTAFLAAAVVGLFEDTIARFTALAVLLPVVAGQSGNAGAQALAVTMRGLALREIGVSHGPRVLFKEMTVGFINGIVIATVTALSVYLWSRSLGLASVMLLSMLCSMVAASAAGAAIPIILVKLGRDPATASSIILTTVTDVIGFFSFLGLAQVFARVVGGL